MMTRREIFADIKAERSRQDEKWGGREHDRQHWPGDWCAFIFEHTAKAFAAAHRGPGDGDRSDYKARLIEVAALAVAAIESLDDD